MDTVFKILCGKKQIFVGGNHCGYDDVMLDCCNIIIRKLKGIPLEKEEKEFCENHLFTFDGKNEQDVEVVVDAEKNSIYFENNFNVIELETQEDFEKQTIYDGELLFANLFSFDEFYCIYNLFKKAKSKYVLVNEKYLLNINKKDR